MKKIILVGGEFRNKGAEAMTFVSVSELKRFIKDVEVVMVNHLKFSEQDVANLKFPVIPMTEENRLYTLGFKEKVYATVKYLAKSILRGKQTKVSLYAKELKSADYVLDISGFSLSSQMGAKRSLKYLEKIETAVKYGCEYVIMPQSIGPFDYNGEISTEQIVKTLSKVRLIFAREKEGYDLLKGLGLTNVIYSNDLVLQCKEIDKNTIYKTVPQEPALNILKNSAAVIPNIRNIEHGSEEKAVMLYKNIVDSLLSLEKNVYFISHCAEDMGLINKIKDLYGEKVNVIEKELNCMEYEEVIKKFDYIIASRYHSIVHAYKECVPAIVIGWAVKYHELVKIFEQQNYIFDIREDCSGIEQAVLELDKNYENESKKIEGILEGIQQSSCFLALKEAIDNSERE